MENAGSDKRSHSSDLPPPSHVEFRLNPQLEGLIELASPDGAYLVLEPDCEGAIVYTNFPRDLAIRMVVAIMGELRKWIDATERL